MQSQLILAPGVTIAAADLDWVVARAGGPGGQHVNTTNSAVQLRVPLTGIQGLDDGARARLAARAGRRLGDDGVLRLDASAERSQFQNRADALARLRSLVAAARIVPKPRRPTQPGRAAKQRRLDAKQRRGALKRDRGGGDSD